ncbi:hypothetical protein ACJJTC_003955 [Scirpophaga incertulas]
MQAVNNNNIVLDLDSINAGKSYLCPPESCSSIIKNHHSNLTFKLISQNIRSVNRNIDEFKVLLSRINIDFDMCIFTESWISTTSIIPTLHNYDLHYTKNNYNQNDGVVLYTKVDLICTIEEPVLNDASCLTVTLNSKTVVIAIYRSPSHKNIAPFIASLDKLLTNYKSYSNILIMGDINIDIRQNDSANSQEYLNMLATHGVLIGHNLPTRLTSCLDHSMIKSNNKMATLVLDTPLTDHSAVISCLDLGNQKYQPERVVSVNRVNYEELLNELSKTSFEKILTSTDVDWAAKQLVEFLSTLLKTHSKQILIPKRTRCLKPWITPGLIRCMRNRDRMHIKCKTEPNNKILKITYTRYKNYCNDLLKRLKRDFERNELQKNSTNPKKTWSTIKSIVYINKQKKSSDELLKMRDSVEESVEVVNEYFANVGKTLADKIPHDNMPQNSLLINTKSPKNSMVMMETDKQCYDDTEKILEIIK